MAIFSANFADLKFDQVEGFRISVAFTPNQGFQGDFFVYLWDNVDARKAFESPLKVCDDRNMARRDTLTITDSADVTYRFPNIELTWAEVGATHSERYRVIEFRCHGDQTDRPGFANIVLENGIEWRVEEGNLSDEYNFKLDDKDAGESLLGFRSRLSPNESVLVRFSALRNKSNSFMKKIIETNQSQIGKPMTPFNIDFKQQKYSVTRENLLRAYVDESFGTFAGLPLPSLSEILATGGEPRLARFRPDDYSASMLLDHQSQQLREQNSTSGIVETATFMFRPGSYRSSEII